MPFCTECGHQNPDNARFCAHCGHRLVTAERPVDSTSTLSNNAEWEALWRIFLPPMGCFMWAFRPSGVPTRTAEWRGSANRGRGSRW